MNLDTVSKSLEIVLGEAMTTADCDITASYAVVGAGLFTLAEADTVSDGTAAVTVVGAPVAGQQRQVKEVTFFNNDTVTHQLILRVNHAGTMRIIASRSIPPNGDFRYVSDLGVAASASAPAVLVESGSAETISAMTAAATLDGTEQVPLVQGGSNVRSTVAGVLNYGQMTVDGIMHLEASGGIIAASSADPAFSFGISWTTGNAGTTSGPIAVVTGDAVVGPTGDVFLWVGDGPTRGGYFIYTPQTTDPLSLDYLFVDPTTQLFRHSTGVALSAIGAQLPASTTNDDAAAGNVGEYLENNTAATSLVTATAKDVATRSLTAGDWDVWGSIVFKPAAGTTVTRIAGSIGTTANTLGTPPNSGAMEDFNATLTAATNQTVPVGLRRISIAATTTVRLVAQATFAVSTMTADGFIGARRVR